jgi:DNA-binding response OmpR family regulator
MADRRQSPRDSIQLSERGVTVWIRTGERLHQFLSTSKRLFHPEKQPAGEGRSVALSPSQPRTLEIANLEIRPAEFQVLADGHRVGLTVREFELFFLLAERLDSVVQRPPIYEAIWGGTMQRRDRSVDVLVRKVRHKLELVAPDWQYIHTHFGIGYRFSPERTSSPS